jgi:UDP-N-acetylmuramate dehydrogenase
MPFSPPLGLREGVPLAPLTTLELGGAARWFFEARTRPELVQALRWAAEQNLVVAVLGGGSNLVGADGGFPGLVVRVALRGLVAQAGGGRIRLSVAAGEPWDWVVKRSVAEDLAGLECLSGIPGTAGATPIQNVGAYGQEVSEVVEEVRVLDRATLCEATLGPVECGFGYRTSLFRSEPDRFVVLAVTFRLRPGGPPTLRYEELQRAVRQRGPCVDLGRVREAVLALRRSKSMVIDPDDPNRRSAGSFFTNPVVSPEEADQVARRSLELGVGEPGRFPAGGGRVKLSAAWLIEHAGFSRGLRRGAVGLSSRHTLALVHHGDGSTDELLKLAREIRAGVEARFGVRLTPEPVFLGFPPGDPLA